MGGVAVSSRVASNSLIYRQECGSHALKTRVMSSTTKSSFSRYGDEAPWVLCYLPRDSHRLVTLILAEQARGYPAELLHTSAPQKTLPMSELLAPSGRANLADASSRQSVRASAGLLCTELFIAWTSAAPGAKAPHRRTSATA